MDSYERAQIMAFIELRFPVVGSELSVDHGYALYSALARVLPQLHAKDQHVAIGPIAGQYAGKNIIVLKPERARLRLRIPPSCISTVLPLAGQKFDVAGHTLRVGTPTVHSLSPAPSLIARIVTIKGFTGVDEFVVATQRQLEQLEIAGFPSIPVINSGVRAGQPRRRIVTVKEKRVVGYSLLVTGLSDDDSIRLQERGIGGRRKMGCGFFEPAQIAERNR